jgi:hypothetical protein
LTACADRQHCTRALFDDLAFEVVDQVAED